MNRRPIVFNADLDLFDPRIINLRAYTHLYKLSNCEELTLRLLFPKFKRLKSLRKLKIDTSFNDIHPEIRWLKHLYKNLNSFSSLHSRAIVPLGKKLSYLNFGPFMHDFRAAYTLKNFKVLKFASRVAKKMTLDLTDAVEDQSKLLTYLSKIFIRSKVQSIYFHASRFNALELTILTQQLKIKPPQNIKIELSSERIVYERLFPLIPFEKALQLNLMMDFNKFKFGMSEIESRIKKLVLVINLGSDSNAITRLRVLERLSSLADTSLIIQYTWSTATFSDVLDTLRMPNSLTKMKVILMGVRENECPAIEEANDEDCLEVLKYENKKVRRFLNHIGMLSNLRSIGFHFRIYGPFLKFYQHFVSAVCYSAHENLRKLKISIDKDELYKGKFDRVSYDCSSVAAIAALKPNLSQIYLVVANPVLSAFKKPTNYPSLQHLALSEFSSSVNNKSAESAYEDFIRALARSSLESLVISLSKSFFEIYSDSDGDLAFKFILALCQKRTMRTLMIPVKFEMEDSKFELMANTLARVKSLNSCSFGSSSLGMLKESYMSQIMLLKKTNPFQNLLVHQHHDESGEEWEDEDDDDGFDI